MTGQRDFSRGGSRPLNAWKLEQRNRIVSAALRFAKMT